MANRYYAADGQRADKVKDLFSAIAPHYDLVNDLQSFGLHRRWKRRLVRLARAHPGIGVLDLCCGTGDLAFSLAEQGAESIGLDFSPPMLAEAMKRARARQLNTGTASAGEALKATPRFVRADALKLPFADAQFDAVTVGYGLRNLASIDRGLQEAWRVTKPGGRILMLDFGQPENALWRALYLFYLRAIVPWFGWLFRGDAAAYAYIVESLQHYPSQNAVAELMRRAGFTRVSVINLLGGIMSIHCGEIPRQGCARHAGLEDDLAGGLKP
jgi:demethylmenaquinone methyltransferase/2-methoxy-6-polyprenyl-1,4-benzoquinol methylase